MKICAYFTCGFPDIESSFVIMKEILEVVDMLEIGIPFSDPIADGPTIQFSSAKALESGFRVSQAFEVADKLKSIFPKKEILLMTYYNIIMRKGEEEFIKRAKDSGVYGIVVPDLIPEEGERIFEIMEKYGLKTVNFVAPTTEEIRIKKIAEKTTGFIYYISVTGTTGEREKLPDDIIENIKKVKKISKKDVFVGFGISKREHVVSLKDYIDGVIVGSAIIRKVIESQSVDEAVKKIREFLNYISPGQI
jgi:tryptophan synthase alpha chain